MSIYDSIGAAPATTGKSIYSSLPTVAPAAPVASVTPGPINRVVDTPISNVVGGAEKTAGDIWDALTAPADTTTGPITMSDSRSLGDDIALPAINTYANAWNDAVSKFQNEFQVASDKNASSQANGIALGEAGLSALNLAFAPISAFLNGTSHIPVLGNLSTAVNNIFGAIGAAGSDGGEGAVAALPISDENKAVLTPLVKSIGALTAQIIAGKGTEETFKALAPHVTNLMNTIHDQAIKPVLDSTGKAIEPNPIVKLPVQGDTTPRSLPVADESTPAAVTLTNTETGQPIVPVSQPAEVTPSTESEITPPSSPQTPAPSAENPVPAVENVPSTPAVASGEQAPTKVANDISDKLVAAGLDKLTPEQKSSYTKGSYKDSAAQAEILKKQDPEALKQMAITGENIPAGVHPQILFNTVDELAYDTKDYRLQQELAKSPLGTERSEHASGLGSSGFNKVSDSPVDVIKDAIKKKAGGDEGSKKIAAEAKKAKDTITKSAKKLMDYQSIIDAIKTC